jgi:predicted Zn-dependent peptidase
MMARHALALFVASLLCACGSKPPAPVETPTAGAGGEQTPDKPAPVAEAPPPSGEPNEVEFPPIVRQETEEGLELNTVEWHQLPVVYLRLVIKSGGETDPEKIPGLSQLVASMLKEGTKNRSSAEIADDVDFLGADLWTGSDEENVYIVMRALSEHLEEALEIMADVTMNPTFRPDELRKLKDRELDRLRRQQGDPSFLARREFHRALYGDHPYAHVDTTVDAVKKVSRRDLMRWHRSWVAPNNAFLTVVGDTTPDEVNALATRKFEGWRERKLDEVEYPEPPSREAREVVVVDRPESEQSVIYIGNLSVPRDHENWVPLQVANQVLGGSAASRLFMDLREKRSLTYGAYSRVGERVRVAPFRASASVRNAVTGQAAEAFFEHLGRIVAEPAPEDELADAQTYLSDSFPLQIDTPGKIASLVADLRIFGLPDTYWETYRSRIREVTAKQAQEAAAAHIEPDRALVLVVGRAAEIVEPLRRWGDVSVLDTEGQEVRTFETTAGETPAAEETTETPE